MQDTKEPCQVSDPSYTALLAEKRPIVPSSGVEPGETHESLFPFQADIVRWSVRLGRAAIFADCGLGKTRMQLEWARLITTGRVLIVAPLMVSAQTIREGEDIGLDVRYVTAPTDDRFQITNYERLHSFDPSRYDAIVLDESSILKSLDGKTRKDLIDRFSSIPNRLCCTATPAPNDITELGNHSEFLGIASFREMSAMFFVKESNATTWRLKGHAKDEFYRWMASWSVFIRRPSDLGYDDDRFILPDLRVLGHEIPCHLTEGGFLFPTLENGIRGRMAARKATVTERVDVAAKLVNGSNQWIVWCGLNQEGRDVAKAIGADAVLIEGSMSAQDKQERARSWLEGEKRVLVTKPSIFGFGMNFQQCSRMLFLGLGDSYEQYYQAIRRCWRFGQTRPVEAHIVTTDLERAIVENVKRKEKDAETVAEGVVDSMREFERENVRGQVRSETGYEMHTEAGEGWTAMLGDSCERIREIDEDSVGFSVYSPPFVSLYTYTNSPRDVGNTKDETEFFRHYRFVIEGLLRATAPGRLTACHVMQVPAMLVRDGYIGVKDFRARVVAEHEAAGWIYHGEVVIDKDPQAQAIRTKSKALLFTQLRKDASWLRPALADYVLVFRKPGENAHPIKPEISNEDWIQWARPIWYGINESDTLNFRDVRTDKDERHICPLQLGVIERCIRLWSNAGDLVCSPFMGIGSEGYEAIRLGRRFVGCELKREYYDRAVDNLKMAQSDKRTLF